MFEDGLLAKHWSGPKNFFTKLCGARRFGAFEATRWL